MCFCATSRANSHAMVWYPLYTRGMSTTRFNEECVKLRSIFSRLDYIIGLVKFHFQKQVFISSRKKRIIQISEASRLFWQRVLWVRVHRVFALESFCSVLFWYGSVLLRPWMQSERKEDVRRWESFFLWIPRSPLRRKQWIHAIRREERKEFKIVDGTEVSSLHFRREDIRQSFNGRDNVVAGGVPSRFAWTVPSQRKRKTPPKRHPMPPKKKLFTTTSTSSQA